MLKIRRIDNAFAVYIVHNYTHVESMAKVKMSSFNIIKILALIISMLLTTNGMANERVPNDIPENIVNFYLNGLGEYATVNNKGLSTNIFEQSVIDNLVRSEVLSYISRQRDISADTLFNTLGLFNTYSKLIDSVPQSLLMDIDVTPMDPNYVFKQIELAYSYYQNEVVNIGFEIELKHLPEFVQQNDHTLALQK
jgi:hypothetical protein